MTEGKAEFVLHVYADLRICLLLLTMASITNKIDYELYFIYKLTYIAFTGTTQAVK